MAYLKKQSSKPYLFIYLSICLSTHLFIYLFICFVISFQLYVMLKLNKQQFSVTVALDYRCGSVEIVPPKYG